MLSVYNVHNLLSRTGAHEVCSDENPSIAHLDSFTCISCCIIRISNHQFVRVPFVIVCIDVLVTKCSFILIASFSMDIGRISISFDYRD